MNIHIHIRHSELGSESQDSMLSPDLKIKFIKYITKTKTFI